MSESVLPYEAPPPDAPDTPKGALWTIFLIVFIDLLGFGIIIPLLPRYVPDFTHNPLKVTLLFSVYSVCQFVGAPILGAVSDRFGRRPVLFVSQLGSALGYVLLGVATTFHWANPGTRLTLVYISRVLDGFTGGNISTAQAYVSDVTTPQNRAKGMGVLGAAFGIGFTAGPFLGGVLGHYNVSWPSSRGSCSKTPGLTSPPRSRPGSTPADSSRSSAGRCWCNCWRSRSASWPRSS
jgi:DHA1 family tetracycline resistance protein-like MFS transporter